jgi:hypothetical protein
VQALLRARQNVDAVHRACLAPAAVDALAAPDAGRLDVRAKCQAAAHDCLLAEDLDFRKAAAAWLVAAVHRGARVHQNVLERFPARQPQASLQQVVYSREPRPRVEPWRLRAVRWELQDE